MDHETMDKLKLDLSIRAKNGVDFIIAASVIWFVIAYVWTLSYTAYDRSILTFIVGSLMLPLAYLLSMVLNTEWKIDDNPLDSLGLWLNFAQLFYFPFLVFMLLMYPDYFVMAYVIITGAHFFPYAWFYDEIAFVVMAGVISVSAMLLGLYLPGSQIFYIPLLMGAELIVLAIWIYTSYRQKLKDT